MRQHIKGNFLDSKKNKAQFAHRQKHPTGEQIMHYLDAHPRSSSPAANIVHLRQDHERHIIPREEKIEQQHLWATVDGALYLANQVTLEQHMLLLRRMIADRKPRPRTGDPLLQAITLTAAAPAWSDLRQQCRIIRAIRSVLR
jgi:hypothetical protein